MTTTEIITRPQTEAQGLAEPKEQFLATAITRIEMEFAVAARQRELIVEYIKAHLHKGKHFYRTPGSEKDVLNKEGSEVICLPHALVPDYDWVGGPQQPPQSEEPYQITLKCRLIHKGSGAFHGAGVGSASSHILMKRGDVIPRQRDFGLRHNSTLKMAAKSAYIAATLSATAASEFFTQDLEPDTDEPPNAQKPAVPKPVTAQPSAGTVPSTTGTPEYTAFFDAGRQRGLKPQDALKVLGVKDWTEWTSRGGTLQQAITKLQNA